MVFLFMNKTVPIEDISINHDGRRVIRLITTRNSGKKLTAITYKNICFTFSELFTFFVFI